MPNSHDDPAQAVEHRSTIRLLRKESVSIQILLPSMDGACPAEVVASGTIDISRYGIRLLLPEPLEAGRIFDVCVKLKDDPKRFLLTGETRWCRYNTEWQGHEVGIMILDGEQTDYSAWSRSVGEEPDAGS